MKNKPAPAQDELRMKGSEFDRMMRGALEVAPPLPEPKKPSAKTLKTKKSAKK